MTPARTDAVRGLPDIRRRILPPLALVLGLLIALGVGATYGLQHRQLNDQAKATLNALDSAYQTTLQQETDVLNGLLHLLADDAALQAAYLAGDRDAVLRRAGPTFETLRRQYRITHYYLHGPDGRVFVRVHEPQHYGDLVDRVTMRQVMARQEAAHGVELGTFGGFVLRVLHPWRVRGRLIGYLELGREVDSMIMSMARVLNVDAVVTLDKARLSRAAWEDYRRALGRPSNWERYADVVVGESTLDDLPDELLTRLRAQQPGDGFVALHQGDRHYRTGVYAIADVSNNTVGRMYFLADTSAAERRLRSTLLILVIGSGALASVVFGFLYFFLGWMDQRLRVAGRDLAAEATLHGRTAAALRVTNRELEAYSYSIAHDLRTPLRAIVSFSQVLAQDAAPRLTAEDKDHLARIVRSGKHMADLIEDILQLSDVARRDIAHEHVDLSALAAEVVEDISTEPAAGTRQVRWDIRPGLTAVGDSRLLRLVLANLLGNAWKYTARNPQAWVRFEQHVMEGRTAFCVEDNGVGFDMQYLDKLFRPFQRLHKPADYEGTGVGLAIVERIVARHGGQVWAEGHVGAGARFCFTLGADGAVDASSAL